MAVPLVLPDCIPAVPIKSHVGRSAIVVVLEALIWRMHKATESLARKKIQFSPHNIAHLSTKLFKSRNLQHYIVMITEIERDIDMIKLRIDDC